MQEIVIPFSESGKKLENYLKKNFPIGYVRKLFRKNAIRINGQRALPDTFIQPSDRIQIFIPFEKQERRATISQQRAIQLQTLFEDDDLLVIDKPPGVAVHEARDILKRETVIGILEAAYKSAGVRPRLVHRLDKETSGILLLGKAERTAQELERLFEEGNINKEYLCLIVGLLPQNEGKIEFPLPGREGHTVPALTRFRVVKRFSTTTLVRARIETGRMHQIRLHFAQLGYPIVMDSQHGDFAFNKSFRKEFGLKRQFLHASRLMLDYRGKKNSWTAPMPRDLEETLKRLDSKTVR